MRDYQTIGLCQTALLSSGTIDATTATGLSTFDFATLVCKEDGDLTDVTLRYPWPGAASEVSVSMKAGDTLYSVKTATITTGKFQVIFHKS